MKMIFELTNPENNLPNASLELDNSSKLWRDLSSSDCLIAGGGDVSDKGSGLVCKNSNVVIIELDGARWKDCPAHGTATIPNAAPNCPAGGWRWRLKS